MGRENRTCSDAPLLADILHSPGTFVPNDALSEGPTARQYHLDRKSGRAHQKAASSNAKAYKGHASGEGEKGGYVQQSLPRGYIHKSLT